MANTVDDDLWEDIELEWQAAAEKRQSIQSQHSTHPSPKGEARPAGPTSRSKTQERHATEVDHLGNPNYFEALMGNPLKRPVWGKSFQRERPSKERSQKEKGVGDHEVIEIEDDSEDMPSRDGPTAPRPSTNNSARTTPRRSEPPRAPPGVTPGSMPPPAPSRPFKESRGSCGSDETRITASSTTRSRHTWATPLIRSEHSQGLSRQSLSIASSNVKEPRERVREKNRTPDATSSRAPSDGPSRSGTVYSSIESGLSRSLTPSTTNDIQHDRRDREESDSESGWESVMVPSKAPSAVTVGRKRRLSSAVSEHGVEEFLEQVASKEHPERRQDHDLSPEEYSRLEQEEIQRRVRAARLESRLRPATWYGTRRRRTIWTRAETERLVRLWFQNVNAWARIKELDEQSPDPKLQKRTVVDLKDKVRNIKIKCLREGIKVPKEGAMIRLSDQRLEQIARAIARHG